MKIDSGYASEKWINRFVGKRFIERVVEIAQNELYLLTIKFRKAF